MCDTCGCNQKGEPHKYLKMGEDLMAYNDKFATENRQLFIKNNILTLNLLSSPGSGKTTLLVSLINLLKTNCPVAVIEGDQESDIDTKKIQTTDVNAIQINTGKACHLDAHTIGHAIKELSPKNDSVLFIENVGNLVCPASFDLGENFKIIFLSVTEGDEKPIKYPFIFAKADAVVITKIDLLPYVNFNLDKAKEYISHINPKANIFTTSATSGEGLPQLVNWILESKKNVSGYPG